MPETFLIRQNHLIVAIKISMNDDLELLITLLLDKTKYS